MAEEHRCQAPRLCANNCGFFGSPATENLCSRCYRDMQLKQEQSSSAKLIISHSLSAPAASSAVSSSSSSSASQPSTAALFVHGCPSVPETAVNDGGAVAQPNRCATCRRRVGLTGFRCRCGMTLCGGHRYPEQHSCTFDFKAMDRDAIAKANPVVKAQKLERI